MTDIAFRVIRLGTSLYVVAFNPPGGEPLLKRKYSFGGAAIKDDGKVEIAPSQRSIEQQDLPFETWNTQIPKGLIRGGFELEINHEMENVILTPVSPRSKELIEQLQVIYTFEQFGIADDRETAIDKAKDKIKYQVRKET